MIPNMKQRISSRQLGTRQNEQVENLLKLRDLTHVNTHVLTKYYARDAKARDNVRRKIAILVFLSLSIYVIIVLIGVYKTRLSGLPTISDFLAEMEDLAAAMVAFLAIYIFIRIYLVLMYTNTTHIHPDPNVHLQFETPSEYRLFQRISRAFSVLLIIQITTILLIGIVKVTTYPTQHYVLAIFGVTATILMEFLLLVHRWKVFSIFDRHYTKLTTSDVQKEVWMTELFGFSNWKPILYTNLLWIVVIIVLACVFTGVQYTQKHSTLFVPISLCEYLLYFIIFYLPSYHKLDVKVSYENGGLGDTPAEL